MGVLSILKLISKPISGAIGNAGKRIDGRASIIEGEVSGNALQRNWRPCLMWMFMFIYAHDHIIVIYVNWMGGNLPMLGLPDQAWQLMYVGIGGYIGGRSVEKASAMLIKSIAKNKKSGGRREKEMDNTGLLDEANRKSK